MPVPQVLYVENVYSTSVGCVCLLRQQPKI
jgi:hypothetical protein